MEWVLEIITMLDLSGIMENSLGIRLHQSTLSAHISQKLNISYKIIKVESEKRNCPTSKQKRAEYRNDKIIWS